MGACVSCVCNEEAQGGEPRIKFRVVGQNSKNHHVSMLASWLGKPPQMTRHFWPLSEGRLVWHERRP